MHPKSLQLCPTLCNAMDCSSPDSSVHRILQTRILEWVAMPSSRGSSQLRDWTHISCTGRQILSHLSHQWSPKEEVIGFNFGFNRYSLCVRHCSKHGNMSMNKEMPSHCRCQIWSMAQGHPGAWGLETGINCVSADESALISWVPQDVCLQVRYKL